MTKKYSKLFAFSIMTFFVSMMPTFAKEVTLEKFSEEMLEIDNKVETAFVIGEYAFTNTYKLTIQDLMLAAQSIKATPAENKANPKANIDEMTIQYVEYEYDKTTGERKGIKVGTNVVGTTPLVEAATAEEEDPTPAPTFTINYINYKYLGADVEVGGELVEAASTMFKDDLLFDGNDESLEIDEDGKLKGLIKHTPNVKYSSEETENTGYYFEFTLEVKGEVTANTVTTAKLRTGANKSIAYESWDEKDTNPSKINLLVAVDPEDETKEFEITVDLDGDGVDYKPATYKIDYSEVTFEKETDAPAVTVGIAEADEEEITSWGLTENIGYEINPVGEDQKAYEITGDVAINTLSEEAGFNPAKGYYITVVVAPEKVQLGKTTIKKSHGEVGNTTETVLEDRSEETFLLQITEESKNTPFTFEIDYDGEGTEYTPYVITIDCSKLNLTPEEE